MKFTKTMDSNSELHLEFIDLTGVDEQEQNEVRLSLRQYNQSVKLPWVKSIKKHTIPNNAKQDNGTLMQSVANHEYTSMVSPPLVNNVYHNHPHVVIHPGYVVPQNMVCYASPPIQTTYPQQILIQPGVHNFPAGHFYPVVTSHQMTTESTEQIIHQNGEHSIDREIIAQNLYNGSTKTLNAEAPAFINNNDRMMENLANCGVQESIETTLTEADVSPVVQNGVQTFDVPPSRSNISPLAQPFVPNGLNSKESHSNRAVASPVAQPAVPDELKIKDSSSTRRVVSPTAEAVSLNGLNSSPIVTKSWASLFNKGQTVTPPVQNGLHKSNETNKEKVMTNNATNVSKAICPIKHPNKTIQFVDPDCYRMGEFLSSYNVEGRAVSLQPRGLINKNNYCYVNSILQALIACPPLYNLLSGLARNVSMNGKRKPTPVIDGMCRFIKEFKHLPANQRVNNRKYDSKDEKEKQEQGITINTDIPIEPTWVNKMLNGMQSHLIEGRQEDAEEFLGCLLNGLDDEMKELINLVKRDVNINEPTEVNKSNGQEEQSKNNGSGNESDDKEWQVIRTKNKGTVMRRTHYAKTPIRDIFGGLLKSKIYRTGDQVTENIQPFFTLQLNIQKVKSIREALEVLVSKNQLEGVTSPKTNQEVPAWQQVLIEELPVILVLHLKCFNFQMNGCKKIMKALEFPIDLKIDAKLLSSPKTQSPKEKQYKLFAVVYHDGKEASKGHYVTDAFHVGYSSWLRYDDSSVKPVQEEQVLNPQGARVPYLLFYRRCDTIRSK